ncbi:acyl carrier protein [Streptomyces sp. NPDC026206]|uniref:acyl carrier protein n=1 Tax=Streptomyces sp. NPDC026206 TaxID=3157089 RepID=UPI0033C092FD
MTLPLFPYVLEELVSAFSVDRPAVTPDATLEELGLDSLALMELTVRFEDLTGVELPEDTDTELGARSTVEEICTALEKALPSGFVLPGKETR